MLRIATRKSELALVQTERVVAAIQQLDPGMQCELVPISTKGDQILDRPLAAVGGKGLFLKELEQAMLDGRVRIAVHSMKDVPGELTEGFALAAMLPRENPFDAFVSNHYPAFEALPAAARLGTSSLRRQCLASALRPDLAINNLRGNVNTRLRKLDAGDYDAIVLAAAGLERLELHERIRERLAPPDWIPAAGQGAIGIECLQDDGEMLRLLQPLNDAFTSACVDAERAVVRCLEGSCQVPIGAFARIEADTIHLIAIVGRPDASEVLSGERKGRVQTGVELGLDLGAELLRRGADKILSDLEASQDE